MDHWFLTCNDDYLKEMVRADENERFKCHTVDTWWMDLLKQKQNIFKFLGALAVNPTWDLGYRFMNVTEVSDKNIPCWCPCNRNYQSYLSDMKISNFMPVSEGYECEHDLPFLSPIDFKAHCHNKNDWLHYLIYQFVIQLHEVSPAKISDGIIVPVPIVIKEPSGTIKNVEQSRHETRG